jgi:hypothetical protein
VLLNVMLVGAGQKLHAHGAHSSLHLGYAYAAVQGLYDKKIGLVIVNLLLVFQVWDNFGFL